jgi:hypothetical protein
MKLNIITELDISDLGDQIETAKSTELARLLESIVNQYGCNVNSKLRKRFDRIIYNMNDEAALNLRNLINGSVNRKKAK